MWTNNAKQQNVRCAVSVAEQNGNNVQVYFYNVPRAFFTFIRLFYFPMILLFSV